MRRSTPDRYDITPRNRQPVTDKPVWARNCAVKRVTFILKMADMFKWSWSKFKVLQQLECQHSSPPYLRATRRNEWLFVFILNVDGERFHLAACQRHSRPFSRLSDCRSPTCGRCTRNAAGTSSPPETASVNSTKTSSARADHRGPPRLCRESSTFSGWI